jgi:hypothetical protein
MATIEERIAALEEKLKQEKAKKQKIEARKRAVESKRQRQDDTRRKVLVGAVILSKVERGEWPESRLRELLDKELTRPHDRALFGLSVEIRTPITGPELEAVQEHLNEEAKAAGLGGMTTTVEHVRNTADGSERLEFTATRGQAQS